VSNSGRGTEYEHIAQLLTGPLRFLWHLHAQDALESRDSG